VPTRPTGPRKLMNILIAGFLGMFLGVFVVFFVEYWQSPRNTEAQPVAPPDPHSEGDETVQ